MYFGLISILWLMAISHVSALDPAIIGGLPKSSFSATTVSPHQECGNYPIFSQSGAWCLNMNAAAPGDYVQVDLGDVFEVSAVSTKGRSDYAQWITKYKLLYSVESGGPFTEYGEFTGNTDQDTEVINALSPSIKAQYLRFLPTAYSGHKSIRVEAYGTEFLADVPGYSMTPSKYCPDQNEGGSEYDYTLQECVDKCNNLQGCVSFEFFTNHDLQGRTLCQPSTTCTIDIASDYTSTQVTTHGPVDFYALDCTNGVEWATTTQADLDGWTQYTNPPINGLFSISTNTNSCLGKASCIRMIGNGDANTNEDVFIQRSQVTTGVDALNIFVEGQTDKLERNNAPEHGEIHTICNNEDPVIQYSFNFEELNLTPYEFCFTVDTTECDTLTLRVGGVLSGNVDFVFVTKVLVTEVVRAAVDCVQSAWANDGECNLLCGTGEQLQTRTIETAAANGGQACGTDTRTIDCDAGICCPSGIGTFAWDTLTEKGIDIPVVEDLYFAVDTDYLTLNISVELKYLGLTKGVAHEKQARYGTTYVLDFEDFDAHKDNIYEPGTCQNRMASSFTSGDFVDDFWDYSDNPQNPNQIGSILTLAYPPSDKWRMLMKDDGCDTIVYSRSFTWSELRGCSGAGANGLPYTEVIHEDDKYKLQGTFYINVVSPFSYGSDLGYYRVYQILSKPFVISVSSTVHVLGSTGIDLIQMYIIAVYKESHDAGNEFAKQDFRLVLMTETAEYLKLELDAVNPIFSFVKKEGNTNTFDSNTFTVSTTPDNGNGCLTNRDYICTQLWNIDAFNPGCIDGQKGTDFSGNYELTFITKCKTGLEESVATHCNTFLTDHLDGDGGNVMLDTDLIWHDNICAVEEFELQFEAAMLFYISDSFVDGTDVGNSHLFEAGVDRIYVEIETSFPTDTYDIFDTVLKNVWICTFPYESSKQPATFADVLAGNANLLDMGCFDSNKDTSLSDIVNAIYPPTTSDIVEFLMHSTAEDDIIRFSFLIPEEVPRDTLYIHAEIEVTLETPIGQPGRRILLEVNTANQISHFGEQIGITHKHKPIKNPQQPLPYNPQIPNPNINVPSSTIYLSLKSPFVILIGSLLVLILMANICYMCYVNCQKRRKRKGYESVKRVDSELDSEAQMLDNQESN